jgi:hypothetical protein
MGKRMRVLAGLVLGLLVGALLAGCGDDTKNASDTTTTTVESTTTTAAATAAGSANGGGGGNSSGGGGGAASGSGSSRTTVKQATGPTPVINTFETPENIDCHNGNFQNFTATWTTTDAVKTTISIDGGGVYKTYAADDEASLPFNCSSSHTFLLTAYGSGGKTATKSVTLQPRNVQGSPDPTEPE